MGGSLRHRARESTAHVTQAYRVAISVRDESSRAKSAQMRGGISAAFAHITVTMNNNHPGTCYCGAVAFEASGQPEVMGYCHCGACRSYSGAPVAAFTLWKAGTVKVTKGADSLGAFQSSEFSNRRYCTKCGGHVMVDHAGIDMVDIAAGSLPTLAFKPTVHLNYEETVLPIKDGLPKLRDFPAEVGGSGETMAE
jgi:hypothetical protein